MKKIITIVSALALTVGLTGCAENNSPAGGISDDTSSLQSSSASQSKSLFEEPIPVKPLPENAIAPDGSTVDFSEAFCFSQTPQDNYQFDYAFVRLAEGKLYTTNEDPSLYDWETNKFTKELSTSETKYIKVKVGDTLANGLTVTRAVTLFENYPGGKIMPGLLPTM